mmetsp:Transcript_26123/g.85896  ORF Transcript_26123/g.85896 Transcript_26123/m.85896 type:complete len:212 (+) Transcript_26123:1545-2180(+)
MYLCDSGAQYADGTTDVTRTMFFGQPEEEKRRSWTAVLKGHIALASACFPSGTFGFQMDVLARQPLWQEGLDYPHGTGHGVGAYLNVHEGPHSISFRRREDESSLQEGMTTSIEPGYYEEGNYGIRLENIMLVEKKNGQHKLGSNVDILHFVPLTLIPFQRKLIVADMLSSQEKEYLNSYHKTVWDSVSPFLQKEEDKIALEWLKENTRPL